MAFVLPPPSPLPVERLFTDSFFVQSCASYASDASTVRRLIPRVATPPSLRSTLSLQADHLNDSEEIESHETSSCSVFNLFEGFSDTASSNDGINAADDGGDLIKGESRMGDQDGLSQRIEEEYSILHIINQPPEVTEVYPVVTITEPSYPATNQFQPCKKDEANSMDQKSLDQRSSHEKLRELVEAEHDDNCQHPDTEESLPPFSRWIKTLRRRNTERRVSLKPPAERWVLDDFDHTPMPNRTPQRQSVFRAHHSKTPSASSSLGFVTAVKSASITLASMSLYPRSRRSARTSYFRSDERSAEGLDPRKSFDSVAPSLLPAFDDGTWARSIQRRRIVEELISSEESYIRDMRTLINVFSPTDLETFSLDHFGAKFRLQVYFTVLPTNTNGRKPIYKSVSQILHLHEDLLNHLKKAISSLEWKQDEKIPQKKLRGHKHMRLRSTESAPSRSPMKVRTGRLGRHSIDTSQPSLLPVRLFVTDTKVVLDVARVFDKFMKHFLAYEAYAAHKDLIDEFTAALRTCPNWSETEKGIEALSSCTIPVDVRGADSKKGLTFSDLLIKPIQRICKYPLFFSDLCKQMPACDDPVAHVELQKVLFRLQDTAAEINRAMDNPKVRRRIETSWILQDRLEFEDALLKPLVFRNLGHVLLCGSLHVVYNTSDRAKGQYMICMLYRSSFVLAVLGKGNFSYRVVAVIPVLQCSMEEPDNGKGLQCHTAQFTWKLVFEFKQHQYEILLSACSAKEGEVWKTHLNSRIIAETLEFNEGRSNLSDVLSLLMHDLKPIGPAFSFTTNFSRRISIHRAVTLGPKTGVNQVIIKNTQARRYANDAGSSLSVIRSQSDRSATHVQTFAPRRTDRIGLEIILTDVWTKEELPYPGMGSRRQENPIRASANSVIRKLSMASITSNFSKRSVSHTSLSTNRDDGHTCSSQWSVQTVRSNRTARKQTQPLVVDFHNTPNAFLPEDFELSFNGNRRSWRASRRASMGDPSERHLQSRMPNLARHSCDNILPKKQRHQQRSKQFDVQAIAHSAALWLDGAVDGRSVTLKQNTSQDTILENTGQTTVSSSSRHVEGTGKHHSNPLSRIFRFLGNST